LIGVGLLVYFLYRSRFVLVTTLMGALIALVLNPLVDSLCRKEFLGLNPRAKRFAITFLIFVFLFVVVGYSVYFLMVPFREEIRRLSLALDTQGGTLQESVRNVQAWYQSLPTGVRDFIAGQAGAVGPRVAEGLRVLLGSTLEWLAHIVELITVPVLAFYFVLDSKPLKREFLYLVPKRWNRDAIILLRETAIILQAYAISQIILCLIAGVVVGAGLWMIHVKYALTLGVLAGITRAIPILGPIIGGIPIVILSGLQSVQSGVAVLIFFSLLHLVESKIIMPKLLGESLHLHPAIILIVLLIGAEFFGVLGMFLATPVAALLKVIYDYYVLRRHHRNRSLTPPAPV
ncbi:MAG: AI-2E family transporter, partial [Armatimonadetes bacterium]|nr:AI-2E family transporter [Armatimonadota bacterium]